MAGGVGWEDQDGDDGAPVRSPHAFAYAPVEGAAPTVLSALSAWSVLEALSPRTYGNPRELVEGLGALVPMQPGKLPWQRPVEPRKNNAAYYRVGLGSIDMRKATRGILDAYGWDEGTVPNQGSHALLGMILLDATGAPITSGTSVSSFGWALPHVMGKDLGRMTRWGEVEKDAVEALNNSLARPNPKVPGKLAPLTWDDIAKAQASLVARFRIPEEYVGPPGIAIRFEQRIRPGVVPSPYLLNSFLLGSIERAHRLVREGSPPAGLSAYLGLSAPADPKDVLKDRQALREVLGPDRIPRARWPAPGGHPLVTLQQAAVNATMSGLADGDGVLAANGPPGTGKTTMIRDIVAANLVERAATMAAFEDPEAAFTKIEVGGKGRVVYVLSDGLRGHEMVVASSNNKAVENVSRELPTKAAVDAGGGVPRYFGTTADYLAGISLDPKAPPAPPGSETWGLVSAALGNSGNRSAFMEGFWWNEDHGIRTWLRVAKGDPVKVTVKDDKGNIVAERDPHLLRSECPPRGRGAALDAWRAVRERFLSANGLMRAELQAFASYEVHAARIPALEADLAKARARIEAARRAQSPAVALGERLARAQDDLAQAEGDLERLTAAKPEPGSPQAGFDLWEAEIEEARERLESVGRTCGRLGDALRLEEERGEDNSAVSQAIAESRLVFEELEKAKRLASVGLRRRIGDRAVDDAFFDAGHDAWNKASPWMDDALQARRAELFGLAMEVHQAFPLAAAKPILRNLSAYSELTGNGSPDLASYAGDLWSSLFLVVPVVSTTFASAGRMLDGLPPGSLGWLIVDEAGQATPQAPVGALTACRRSLFVGDPLQVEPVTTLPRRLVTRICDHFDIEASAWTAPTASAQAFADRASPLRASFAGIDGERSVGMPLLVHRRCQEPMFGISNRIAYDGQMVHAVPDRGGEAHRSAWFDIHGPHDGKWCPNEGEFAATILTRMTTGGRVPDVFFISPFREVAANLRQRLLKEAAKFAPDPAAWVRDRVGTVHTFQGREAESVVLVLGAGEAAHAGARAWASRTPNIANVAVTRAKSRLYVVGAREAWGGYGSFREVADSLPAVNVPGLSAKARRPEPEPEDEPQPGLRGFGRSR